MIIFLKRNVHKHTECHAYQTKSVRALSFSLFESYMFALLFPYSLFPVVMRSNITISICRQCKFCRRARAHTMQTTTNNNKEHKKRGTKAWLVMFCNCLDSLLGGGGGDDDRASNSSSSNVCAVYILILASLHGIICFSAFGSVRFVQCILCCLPSPSPNPRLSCLSITILWRAHIVPSNASIGFRCTLFRFFIFSGI